MLEGLFGSLNQERVLIFLLARGKGYGAEIAKFYETDISPIQKQLEKLEGNGILSSEKIGRTILYQFNPRYSFLKELKQLLNKAISFLTEEKKDELYKNRKRPRRQGKPL